MRLRDALLRVAKFAHKDAGARAYNAIRLVPPAFNDGDDYPTYPAYVMATNGTSGMIVHVDPRDSEFPDIAVDAKAVVAALKGVPKGEAFTLHRRSTSSACLETRTGAKHIVSAPDHTHYPDPPPFPRELHRFERYDLVKAVLHAASKDGDTAELAGVHFHPEWTEATDQSRIARSALRLTHESQLVPAEVFKGWPAKKKPPLGTACAFTPDTAFFWVDGELRWTKCLDVTAYFELSSMFPPQHLGTRVMFQRAHLKQSVKMAMGSTEKQWVELRIGDDSMSVSGIDAAGAPQYVETLPAVGAAELVCVMLRGKLLWEALHNMPDDVVTLCYSHANSPIRLEGNNFIEAVWPLIVAEG